MIIRNRFQTFVDLEVSFSFKKMLIWANIESNMSKGSLIDGATIYLHFIWKLLFGSMKEQQWLGLLGFKHWLSHLHHVLQSYEFQ